MTGSLTGQGSRAMRGKRWTLAAGLCLLSVAMVVLAADTAGPLNRAPSYPRRELSGLELWDVLRVVGPDHVILKKGSKQQTVRLVGLAVPQLKSPGLKETAYQSRAVEFLSNLLSGERVFVLRGPRQRQGLQEVKLFREPDGLYVNLEVVRQGYSPMAPGRLGTEQRLFQVYQQRARQAGKGLWGLPAKAKSADQGQGKNMVYVTKAGKKYHRGDCQFLAKSKIAMSLSQAKSRGYTACKICKPAP